jgi:hypothetical protein
MVMGKPTDRFAQNMQCSPQLVIVEINLAKLSNAFDARATPVFYPVETIFKLAAPLLLREFRHGLGRRFRGFSDPTLCVEKFVPPDFATPKECHYSAFASAGDIDGSCAEAQSSSGFTLLPLRFILD